MSSSVDSDSDWDSEDYPDFLNECRYKTDNKQFKIFKEQDLEKGRFDVSIEVEGKILHAHQFILTSVSETMDAWLSGRWTTKDEVIKIRDYSYKSFYEFLRFLYTSDCKLTKENVYEIVDMAEFYGVSKLKKLCDRFLCDMKTKIETMEEMFDLAQKYSLRKLKKSIKVFFVKKNDRLCNSEAFILFKKPFVEFLFTNRFVYYHNDIDDYCYEYDMEAMFKGVYKWAEHRVIEHSYVNDGNFNLFEAIKAELSTILPYIKFTEMKLDFLKNFVVEKGFVLSPTELSEIFLNQGNGNRALNIVYKLAKKQALKQQEMFPVKNFYLVASVRAYLTDVFLRVRLSKMSFCFLMNFVGKTGFFLSPHKLSRFFFNQLRSNENYSDDSTDYDDNDGLKDAIENTYKLAKKQVLKQQEMFPVENFILVDSVKASLVKVIPKIEFYKLDEEYLMNYIVENRILSKEQAYHVSYTRVQLKHNGKTITGVFKDDDLGIRIAFEKNKSCSAEHKLRSPKIRFPNFKFKVPKTPSTVTKMKGCEWYLCLESDGILTFKHHSVIQKSDYLIAEMKSRDDFILTPGKMTSITACYNNV